MRSDLVESLCIGGCIALTVLVVHAFTADARPQIQVLALLAAAVVVAGGQVVFTRWRQRRGIPPGNQPADQTSSFLRLRRNRRNPFFRELTSDWTGLDEHLPDDERATGAARTSRSGDPPNSRGDDPHRL